jgi:hypothetical protein
MQVTELGAALGAEPLELRLGRLALVDDDDLGWDTMGREHGLDRVEQHRRPPARGDQD